MYTVCVCVCVREREREKDRREGVSEREREGGGGCQLPDMKISDEEPGVEGVWKIELCNR